MSQLTAEVFAEGIAVLSARWNREIPAALSGVMAEWLARQNCTADEYIAGVKRAAAELQFFPSAKEILELGRPELPGETAGAAVFAALLELRKYVVPHGNRLALDDVEAQLGESARRALVAIGGSSRVINLTDEHYPFVCKEFSRHYAAFDAEAKSRAAAGAYLTAGTSRAQLERQGQRRRLKQPVPIATAVPPELRIAPTVTPSPEP